MEFKDIYRTHPQTNVSAVAQNGSNLTQPVFNNCTITGNVCITHNASGISGYHPDSDKTPQSANPVICKYKKLICSEYQHVTEYNSLPGENVLLCQRYTEPLIIQKHRDQKEREEEISSKGESFQKVLSSRSSHESVLNSLFHTDDHGITPRAVILQGNSGNGKSFVVQKIMMDWASGNLYKDQFDVVFHLKCKEINCIPGEKSLLELLSWSCGLTSDEISQMLQWSPERVLFIIDGFDELRLPQDDNNVTSPTDPDQRCTPVFTLCALLRGHLQVNSFLLVTSRSTATDTLSRLLKNPQRFTEIMGFSERGVEEYFQKFFQNEELFRNAYTFVKDNETLLTACSIPVICWIICTVIRERFNDGADITSGLETTTSIYVDFVFTLLKYHSKGLNQSGSLNLLMSLGQLAERGMQKQQVLFDEKIINETVQDPACCLFLCKFLFKRRIQQETMFSFMHLSFQEFFTALYYVCLDKDQAMMNLTKLCTIRHTLRESFYEPPRFSDVVKFAFGLLNKDLQCTLIKHGLFVHQNVEADLKQWFINKICKRPGCLDPFVFNYLYELHEKSFVEEAMQTWNKIHIRSTILRRTDCWALKYCAQCFHSVRSLNLGDSELTPDKLSIILPVVHKFESLWLYVEIPTDSDLVDLMCAVTRGHNQSVNVSCVWDGPADEHCSVHSLQLSVSDDVSRVYLGFYSDVVRLLGLTLPRSEAIDWAKLFQIFHKTDLEAFTSAIRYLPKIKKLELNVDFLNKSLSLWILSIGQNVSSLTELKIDVFHFLLEDAIEILQRSQTRPNCTLTIEGFKCNKPSQKCTQLEWSGPELSCNQQVVISVNCQGFTERTLTRPLFWD